MIFGIKTKKDKKIEALQTEIAELKKLNSSIIRSNPCKIITYESAYDISDKQLNYLQADIENIVKRNLTEDLISAIMPQLNLTTEHIEHPSGTRFKVKIEVVKR